LSSSFVKDDTNLVDNTNSSPSCDALDRPVCLAHLSDIHVTADSAWTKRDLFSKRITGWINLKISGLTGLIHTPGLLCLVIMIIKRLPAQSKIILKTISRLGKKASALVIIFIPLHRKLEISGLSQ